MSLETKIEELTKAITHLSAVMESLRINSEPMIGAPTPVPEPKEEVLQQVQTHDDLKKLCLSTVRKLPNLKDAVKGLLESYGAAKANEVPSDKIGECMDKIAALGAK